MSIWPWERLTRGRIRTRRGGMVRYRFWLLAATDRSLTNESVIAASGVRFRGRTSTDHGWSRNGKLEPPRRSRSAQAAIGWFPPDSGTITHRNFTRMISLYRILSASELVQPRTTRRTKEGSRSLGRQRAPGRPIDPDTTVRFVSSTISRSMRIVPDGGFGDGYASFQHRGVSITQRHRPCERSATPPSPDRDRPQPGHRRSADLGPAGDPTTRYRRPGDRHPRPHRARAGRRRPGGELSSVEVVDSLPRPHRRPRRHPRRLPHRRCRTAPGRPPARADDAVARHRAGGTELPALHGVPLAIKDLTATAGMRDDLRLGGVRGPGSRGRRRRRRDAGRRRDRQHRQDQRPRVRTALLHREPAGAAGPHPARPDPDGRRLVRRRGGRGRGRPAAVRARHRRRRVAADPGRDVRTGRAQDQPRPDLPRTVRQRRRSGCRCTARWPAPPPTPRRCWRPCRHRSGASPTSGRASRRTGRRDHPRSAAAADRPVAWTPPSPAWTRSSSTPRSGRPGRTPARCWRRSATRWSTWRCRTRRAWWRRSVTVWSALHPRPAAAAGQRRRC